MSPVAGYGHMTNSGAERYAEGKCLFWELFLKGEDVPSPDPSPFLLPGMQKWRLKEGPAVVSDYEVEMKIVLKEALRPLLHTC